MNNNRTFDILIKKALSEGEDNIRLNLKLASEAKLRLMSEKERNIKIMNRIKLFSEFNLKNAAAVCCSIILLLVISFIFIPPVRAVGERVKTMIYDIVKGKDGKYVPVQVPYIEPEKRKKITCEGDGTAVKEDIILKIPKNLAGGYTFSHQAFGLYNSETGSIIASSVKNGNWKKVYMKLNELVTTFYRRDKSIIVLGISCVDAPFSLNSRREIIEGDNKKDIFIGAMQASYAEYPGARFPVKWDANRLAGEEDRTKKPVIKMLHTIKWKHNQLYYTMYDFNGDLSLEELKVAAATVIESMM